MVIYLAIRYIHEYLTNLTTMSDKPKSEYDKMSSQSMVRAIVADLKMLDKRIKKAGKAHEAKHRKRFQEEIADRWKDRTWMAIFAEAELPWQFVGTVEGRGHVQEFTNVLLKNIHLFGISYVLVDHVWCQYDKHWKRVEPFFQGAEMMIYGCPARYERKGDGTVDYEFKIQKLVKLS